MYSSVYVKFSFLMSLKTTKNNKNKQTNNK